eukprot:COSAG05_NODE_180_length_14817_cov_423.925262_16_plen_363_part_00
MCAALAAANAVLLLRALGMPPGRASPEPAGGAQPAGAIEPEPEPCTDAPDPETLQLVQAVRDAMAAIGNDAGIKKLVAKVKALHPELQAGGRKVGAKEVRVAMLLVSEEAEQAEQAAEIVGKREEILAAHDAGGGPAGVAVAQAHQLEPGGGLGLEGFPTGSASYNGLYRRKGGLHEGWPRYENTTTGKQLFCLPSKDHAPEWHVHKEFATSGYVPSAGFIISDDGAVPAGEYKWRILPVNHKSRSANKWATRGKCQIPEVPRDSLPITVHLLTNLEDASAFQLRIAEAARKIADRWPAKRQRTAAVAQAQRLGGGGGLLLEGHPVNGVNGVYVQVTLPGIFLLLRRETTGILPIPRDYFWD